MFIFNIDGSPEFSVVSFNFVSPFLENFFPLWLVMLFVCTHLCSGCIFEGNGNGGYKVNDLNVQADEAPADGDDDDVDWEEG